MILNISHEKTDLQGNNCRIYEDYKTDQSCIKDFIIIFMVHDILEILGPRGLRKGIGEGVEHS